MELVTVYRYENAEGIGPYRAGSDDLMDMVREHNNPDIWPNWQLEGFFINDEKCKSACPSLETLEAWFAGWENVLELAGFYIKEYQVMPEETLFCPSGKQIILIGR